MRSLLFVPADSEKKIPKALGSAADIVILDLEDSVAAANKPAARALAAEVLRSNRDRRVYVRVNALDTGLTLADLEAALPARPHGLVLPKSTSAEDVTRLHALIMMIAPGDEATPVIAIATETAASIFHMGSYVNAHPRLEGLNWGMEDLAAALGAQSNRDESGEPTGPYRLARTLTLFAARAAGVAPIDAVYSNFRDTAGLLKQCREAARDGFTAKMCIHPDQVGPINEAFTPSPAAIARARRIVEAFAAAGNPGVLAVDGEMLDAPHLKAAQALLRNLL
ncbi:MAG: CoA ester lyase [Rhizobiales bacterium]|nr:CoA ester lyase [Hyphomicrobiales bacterium]